MDFSLRNIDDNTWLVFIFLGIFVLIVIGKQLYPRRFQEFLMLPVTDKYFAIEGKNYEFFHPFTLLMFTVQVAALSLILYFLKVFFGNGTSNAAWVAYIQMIAASSVFILSKFYLEKIVGVVFNIETYINKYLFEKLSYTNWLALLMAVGCFIIFYSSLDNLIAFKIFIPVVGVLFLIALLSTYKRNSDTISRNFFYFILYLCALEIAPLLILYKIVS